MSDLLNTAHSLVETRVWPQHQAILTLVHQRLTENRCTEFNWLDLGCGKGQVLAQLQHNISSEAHRGKIHYSGYDIDPHSTKIAETHASTLALKSAEFHNGHLRNFNTTITQTALI